MIVCSWLCFSSGLYSLAERLAFSPRRCTCCFGRPRRAYASTYAFPHELRARNTSIFNALRFSSSSSPCPVQHAAIFVPSWVSCAGVCLVPLHTHVPPFSTDTRDTPLHSSVVLFPAPFSWDRCAGGELTCLPSAVRSGPHGTFRMFRSGLPLDFLQLSNPLVQYALYREFLHLKEVLRGPEKRTLSAYGG